MSANHKAAAAWDDYVSQQQEEKIEQLECELNAANDRIKQLDEENNELRAEEARLLNTNGELERRIKRLEEAGGRMADVLTWSAAIQYKRSPTVAAWRKAKEAKP